MSKTEFGWGGSEKRWLRESVMASALLLACSKGTTDASSSDVTRAPTAPVKVNFAEEEVDPKSGVVERLPVRAVDEVCAASSVEFRRAISPCLTDMALCGEVVSVDFDSAGRGTSARFLTTITAEAAPAAESALACVKKGLGAISNRCPGMHTRHYRQSCTLK